MTFGRTIVCASELVFHQKRYVLYAVCAGVVTILAVVFFSNRELIGAIAGSSAPGTQKITTVWHIVGGAPAQFGMMPFTAMTITAFLFGIYIAMLLFARTLPSRRRATASTALGIGGVITSALGIGCAACGSLLITALPVVGVGAVASLPLHGLEIMIISIGLLVLSIYLVARRLVGLCKKPRN